MLVSDPNTAWMRSACLFPHKKKKKETLIESMANTGNFTLYVSDRVDNICEVIYLRLQWILKAILDQDISEKILQNIGLSGDA